MVVLGGGHFLVSEVPLFCSGGGLEDWGGGEGGEGEGGAGRRIRETV